MEPIATTSFEAYYLFDDREWYGLLMRKGVDLTRAIRYKVVFNTFVNIYYDDTFIGAEI